MNIENFFSYANSGFQNRSSGYKGGSGSSGSSGNFNTSYKGGSMNANTNVYSHSNPNIHSYPNANVHTYSSMDQKYPNANAYANKTNAIQPHYYGNYNRNITGISGAGVITPQIPANRYFPTSTITNSVNKNIPPLYPITQAPHPVTTGAYLNDKNYIATPDNLNKTYYPAQQIQTPVNVVDKNIDSNEYPYWKNKQNIYPYWKNKQYPYWKNKPYPYYKNIPNIQSTTYVNNTLPYPTIYPNPVTYPSILPIPFFDNAVPQISETNITNNYPLPIQQNTSETNVIVDKNNDSDGNNDKNQTNITSAQNNENKNLYDDLFKDNIYLYIIAIVIIVMLLIK